MKKYYLGIFGDGGNRKKNYTFYSLSQKNKSSTDLVFYGMEEILTNYNMRTVT